MAYIECANGHMYDPSLFSTCPHCRRNQEQNINFRNDAPTGGRSETVAPGGLGGRVSRETVAPNGMGGRSSETVQPRGYSSREREKTVGTLQNRLKIDPIVGWLVCLSGKEKGHDFRLRSKINTLGRGEDNDISVKGDLSISERDHIRIAYDPKHNVFAVMPGLSTSSTGYLNEMPIYQPMPLKARDQIECGNSRFLFVPLCDDSFCWEKEE